MTHSGGKPHAVGDRCKRFEVSYFDPDANCRKKFGWAATAEGAQDMAKSIELHPSMQFPQILDRWAQQESNRLAREGNEPDEECEAGVLHWDAPKPLADT